MLGCPIAIHASTPPLRTRPQGSFPEFARGSAGESPRIHGLVKHWSRSYRSGVEHYSLGSRAAAKDAQVALSLDGGVEVTERRIWVRRLPQAFRGFRIVHLTDIHHGLFLPLRAAIEAVELANQLEPDLVALTGDFVTYSRSYIEPVAAALGGLRARYGVLAVLGNHDYRVGGEQMARALRRERVEVLRNANVPIHRGQSLYVAGIDDYGYGADLPRALRGIPPGAPTVLLAHNPRIIRRAARNGVSLVLSGHTHGGQVNLPFVGTIYGRSPEQMRFKIGWDRLGPTQIYVSRGIGTVVLPLRVRCPAEIPHLELQPHEIARGPYSRLAAES